MDYKVKKQTTWKGLYKHLTFSEGQIVDENGEIVDIVAILRQFYEDKHQFDISVYNKEEEEIEYEEVLDI